MINHINDSQINRVLNIIDVSFNDKKFCQFVSDLKTDDNVQKKAGNFLFVDCDTIEIIISRARNKKFSRIINKIKNIHKNNFSKSMRLRIVKKNSNDFVFRDDIKKTSKNEITNDKLSIDVRIILNFLQKIDHFTQK